MEYAYDWFLDENPDVLERVDKGRAEGRIKGRAQDYIEGRIEGEREALQRLAMTIVTRHFPALALQAQPVVKRITNADELDQLILQLTIASDEAEACKALRIGEQ